MSDETQQKPEPPPGRRPRPWWRPGPRVVIEVMAIVSAAAGLVVMRGRGEFPRPMIRALQSGPAAEKADALRALSLFGRAGEEAIPGLLGSLRDDPSPSIRQGSAFVLAAIVSAPEVVEPFSIDDLLAGSVGKGLEQAVGGVVPRPHPEVERVVAGLVRSIRDDPDPTVRGESIAALGPLLDAAMGLRPPPERPFGTPFGPVGPPAPPRSTFEIEPWMREAAGVIADRASSEDGAESRRATAWVVAEPSARLLLDDDRRDDVLALGGASAAQDPETFLDILLVKAAALAVRGDPGRRPAFLDAIAHALARPRPAAPANIPPNQPGQPFWEPGPSARPFDPDEHATVFWMAGPSADEVADHPEVIDATLRIMSLDRRFSRVYADRSSSAESRVEVEVRQFIQAEHRGTISGRDAPWLMLRAIADDPSILDLAADRLDAEEWRRLLDAQGPWDELKSACLDPKLRPALSANRSESAPLAVLEAIERLTEDQEEPRNRALAVLSYFVRGASPGSEARNRFEGIVEAMLGDPREDRQGFGKLLGRSLAPTDSGPGGATAPGEDAPPPDPALRR